MKRFDQLGHDTLETMSFAKWYNERILSLMAPYIGKSTLEIGAGIGNFTHLLQKITQVTATDINKNYVKKLQEKLGGNGSIGYGDIEKDVFFFTYQKFDSVIGLNVLEHIKDDMKAIRNINKHLKKGGNLVLLVPAHKYLFGKFDRRLGHYRRYSLNSIRFKLVKSGFTIEKISYINWWGAIGWLIFMKILGKDRIPKFTVVVFDLFGKLFLYPEKLISLPFGLSVFVVAKKQ